MIITIYISVNGVKETRKTFEKSSNNTGTDLYNKKYIVVILHAGNC